MNRYTPTRSVRPDLCGPHPENGGSIPQKTVKLKHSLGASGGKQIKIFMGYTCEGANITIENGPSIDELYSFVHIFKG